MEEAEQERDRSLAIARGWMTKNALKLQERLHPVDAAGVLIGAACGIIEASLGREKLIEMLLGVAAEYEDESRRRFEADA